MGSSLDLQLYNVSLLIFDVFVRTVNDRLSSHSQISPLSNKAPPLKVILTNKPQRGILEFQNVLNHIVLVDSNSFFHYLYYLQYLLQ